MIKYDCVLLKCLELICDGDLEDLGNTGGQIQKLCKLSWILNSASSSRHQNAKKNSDNKPCGPEATYGNKYII